MALQCLRTRIGLITLIRLRSGPAPLKGKLPHLVEFRLDHSAAHGQSLVPSTLELPETLRRERARHLHQNS